MVKNKLILAAVILGAAGLILAGYFLYTDFFSRILWKNSEKKSGALNEASYIYFSHLDGSGVSSAAEEMPDIVAAMIDNHPEALPQAGLSLAKVVYEVPVEGGFTRFMAIFNREQAVIRVGPIRSARPYFLDWAQEYGNALYLHSGGSPEALNFLENSNIFDANEFYRGKYYWRDNDRSVPHNLYTNSDSWRQLIKNYGANHAKQSWTGWNYGELGATAEANKSMAINFSPHYTVSWNFNEPTGRYERLINAAAHTDEDGRAIVADNIIIQRVAIKVIDDEGRKEITTIGKGEALVLRQGKLLRGTWQKKSAAERTKFYDAAGVEISLTPGITWVEVIPKTAELQVTN